MAFLRSRNSGVFFWVLALAPAAYASSQAILADHSHQPQTTADPSVVKYYQDKFDDWSLSKPHVFHGADAFCTGCTQAPGCCPMGGWLTPPSRIATLASPTSGVVTVTITQSCGASNAPALPGPTSWRTFTLPTTILASSPTRETIFRVPTSTPAVQDSPTAAKISEPESVAEPIDSTNAAGRLKDITQTYYDFAIDGHHPFIMPIILLDGAKTPITLLATVNTGRVLSFISASLLDQLKLTSQVGASTEISDNDVTRILGIKAASRGKISLNVFAGRDDRKLPDNEFVVFEPTHRVQGDLHPDIIVGMDFLNAANALSLSSEYAGVGAKEGLGIVVQRVYAPNGSSAVKDSGSHDEL